MDAFKDEAAIEKISDRKKKNQLNRGDTVQGGGDTTENGFEHGSGANCGDTHI